MKFSFEGEPEEFEGFLKLLREQRLSSDLSEGERKNSAPTDKLPLTPEEIPQLINKLTDEARKLLFELAKRPEGYPFADLQRVTRLSGTQISGRMSSIGHKMHNFPGKAEPVTRDYSQRVYYMQPEVAQAIRELQQS